MQARLESSLRFLSKGVFATADLVMGPWPGPRILIYHQIIERPAREMDVSPLTFESHLRWLLDHGRLVDLEEALRDPDRLDAQHDFVLTFDDGYEGVYSHAFPLLEEHGVPFILYITSQMIDQPSETSPDALTWDQINEMQESGLLTVAAHTHTHPDLRDLTADQLMEELDVSNELIERRTGVRAKHFAYTKGYWSEAAEPFIASRYETAVLGGGPPVTSDTNPLRLSRVPVQRSDGQFFFVHKLKRGMRLEESVRRRIKRYENPSPTRA